MKKLAGQFFVQKPLVIYLWATPPPITLWDPSRGKKIGQTWARTSKRSLGERRKRAVRSRSRGGKRQRRQQGAEEAEPRAPPQLPKVQDVASLQSLPAPFGPLLAASPSSPSPQCANSQTRDEAQSLRGNSKPLFGAQQVTKRRSKTQSSRLTASVPTPRHRGVPHPTRLSTDPNTTFQSKTLSWKGIVLRSPSLPLRPESPNSEAVLGPVRRPARNWTPAPKPKRKPPILSPETGGAAPQSQRC